MESDRSRFSDYSLGTASVPDPVQTLWTQRGIQQAPDLWKPSLGKQTDLEADNRNPGCFVQCHPDKPPYTGK